MVQSVIDILRQVNEPVETTTCIYCGHLVDITAETCLHCGARIKLPTLLEYGRNLPIGLPENNKLHKKFDIRKISFQLEMKISESWDRFVRDAPRGDVTPFHQILVVLAHTITKLAGEDFQKLSFEKRLGVLRNMFDGDIWYIYANVRLATMGPDIELIGFNCFHCNKRIDSWSANIETLEISTIESFDKLTKVITLNDVFSFRNRVDCKKVKIQPSSILSLLNSSNKSSFEQKIEKICSSVIEVEDFGDINFVPEDLERMSKSDRDFLSAEIDRHAGGPQWTVEVVCPHESCGEKFVIMLPVRFDDFFARSFRYDRGRIF